MVVCLEQGADLHMAQLMPLPLTVSCYSKIHTSFTFLVPAHLGSPGKRAVKRVCACMYCSGMTLRKLRPVQDRLYHAPHHLKIFIGNVSALPNVATCKIWSGVHFIVKLQRLCFLTDFGVLNSKVLVVIFSDQSFQVKSSMAAKMAACLVYVLHM